MGLILMRIHFLASIIWMDLHALAFLRQHSEPASVYMNMNMKTFCSSSVLSLLCLSLITGYAAETNSASAKPEKSRNAAEAAAPGKGLEKEMLGVTLVADKSLGHIDHFRTLGMRQGFGSDQPLCDFIATDKWVSKRGASIEAGEKIKIGKATLVETTDGFGNTGTKLILDSAEPKEGLVFYCYAFNSREKAYWAIDKKKIKKALSGYFHIEE